ncbi:MAG: hypothetical protein L6Q33_13230 [Bacteriovoracaceae bacterium]|jgi:hypothetical protein|nr:hypothetical protein [Bacteriovoracaceae bacterium]
MKKTTLLRFSGLALLILGLVLFSMAKNQKKNPVEIAEDPELLEVTQEVSLTNAGLQKTEKRDLKSLIQQNLKKQQEEVENKISAQPQILQKRSYTESEIANMSVEEFKIVLDTTEAQLPTIKDIRSLPPGALHHVPTPIIQAGKDMGLIKEILAVHPDYRQEAQGFYEICAENDDRPQAVRALCLTNLIQLKKENGEKLNTASYPKEIVELSKLVIDL